jgi:ribosomal protein S27E
MIPFPGAILTCPGCKREGYIRRHTAPSGGETEARCEICGTTWKEKFT